MGGVYILINADDYRDELLKKHCRETSTPALTLAKILFNFDWLIFTTPTKHDKRENFIL